MRFDERHDQYGHNMRINRIQVRIAGDMEDTQQE